MQVKKNPKFDLENKRSLFLQIGLLLSLAFTLAAFEYKTPAGKVEEYIQLSDLDLDVEEIVPNTPHQHPKKICPPQVKPIEILDIIIADDNDETTDLEIIDSYVDQNEGIFLREVSEDTEIDNEDVPFVRVEIMPIFNPSKNKTYEQGKKDLFYTMQKNAKYPLIALENGIEGKVFFKFVVTKTGEIGSILILRSADSSLEKEAIRVVKNLPKFKPGMQRNIPVSVWFNGYISFCLQ